MAQTSRSRKKASDEKYFPIRIRIHVPEEGFGSKMEAMDKWLDERAGRGRWGSNGDNILSREAQDAMSVYLLDAGLVAPFLEAFGLTLAVGDPALCGNGSFNMAGPIDPIVPSPAITRPSKP